MAKHKIAWLPGDGIGQEVMEALRIVLDELGLNAEYIHGDIGWEFWKKEGNPLPDRTIEMMKQTDCGIFGAITSKPPKDAAKELDPSLRDKGYSYFSPIVRLRQEFDLYTCKRPSVAFEGNPLNLNDEVDITVFRENTEGSYAGVEYWPSSMKLREAMLDESPKMKRFMDEKDNDIAISSRIITRSGAERIIRSAFEHADTYGKTKVTLAEKPNVIRKTGGLMVEVFENVAAEYPKIDAWFDNIDAICMWLVKSPEKYEVIVAENLFGDIVSDLVSQLVGGLGFARSGNEGAEYAVFEPVHGSAPKYFGQYKVNPFAMLLAGKMALEYLGEMEMAQKLQTGVEKTIKDGSVLTYDMNGTGTTLDVARAVARHATQ